MESFIKYSMKKATVTVGRPLHVIKTLPKVQSIVANMTTFAFFFRKRCDILDMTMLSCEKAITGIIESVTAAWDHSFPIIYTGSGRSRNFWEDVSFT